MALFDFKAAAELNYAFENYAETLVLPAVSVAANDILVATFAYRNDAPYDPGLTPTDNSGNTWTAIGSAVNQSGDGLWYTRHYYCIAGSANAALVLTGDIDEVGRSVDRRQASITVYEGAAGVTADVVSSVAATPTGGTNSAFTSAAFTTTAADELIVFAITQLGLPVTSAPAGFTQRAEWDFGAQYSRVVSALQTGETVSITQTGVTSWTMKTSVVSFKAAGGGGTAPGLATETDTALALAGKQIRAAGMATETDTALALVTLAGLPFNTAPYEFGQRTGLDVDDFSIYASTSLNVSVYAATDVLLASQLFAYTESTGTDGRLTRKTHASLTAGTTYIFVAVTTGGALVAAGRITAT